MDLILKPTEACNFRCTFCSSTSISENSSDQLDLENVKRFVRRYPETNTIIINGGDPLMMSPSYYWEILEFLEEVGSEAVISFTTNLWAFYKKPEKWEELFKHPQVGVATSFQYGGERLKGDGTEFTEEEFWKVSDLFLERIGYRPSFIAVITENNADSVIKTVELAKAMGVECKVNYAFSSGPQVVKGGVTMGNVGGQYLLADIYQHYLEIYDKGLTDWEFNTQQMTIKLQGANTTCPLNRDCDAGIRTLQPSGRYYSCGAFGDDNLYSIDFEAEMNGEFHRPLQGLEFLYLKESCLTCPLYDICNGCKKTIHDLRRENLVEQHCFRMKQLAPRIIEANGLTGLVTPTPYVKEVFDEADLIPITQS